MLPDTKAAAAIVDEWLAQLERALGRQDAAASAALFHADSHWRDVLALTWDIRTVSGAASIIRELVPLAIRIEATGFRWDRERTPPREVTRAGAKTIEAILAVETSQGRCNGVLRIVRDPAGGGAFKAWTLVTMLDEIKGHEEMVGRRRPSGRRRR